MSEDSQNNIVNRSLWIYALLLVAMAALTYAVYFASGAPNYFAPSSIVTIVFEI